MMAIFRNLFPVGILCLVFFRGYCPLPTSSSSQDLDTLLRPTKFYAEDPDLGTEDYDRVNDASTTVPNRETPSGRSLQRCDYNPCLQGQTPCKELARLHNCLCPGFTVYSIAPEAPHLKSVSWNGSDVVVSWCAPYSHVTAYVVTVGGEERQNVGEDQRSATVGDIGNIAKVCVVAVNNAGTSDGSCMMYHPKDNNLPLTVGLIGGALGFLLLLFLVILLWRHKKQRKQQASISMHNTAEVW